MSTVLTNLKLDRAAYMLLIALVTAVGVLVEGLVAYFYPGLVGTLILAFVTAIVAAVIVYLTTESSTASTGSPAPSPINAASIVPHFWSRRRSQL